MAKNNVADLLSVGSLFTTQAERDEAQRETIRDIPLEEISDFPNHPFKVRMDASMMEMVDSVKQHGVLVPALVRPKPDGGYEMIAGHRRRKASELAEKQTLSCIVRDMTDDEATIVMVDSNLQREQILPSEKAFAYKMKLDAMKRQAGRPLKNVSQVGTNIRSDQLLADEVGESRNQIQRYVRLTYLVKPLRDMVDGISENGFKIAMNPAYELSFLKVDEQNDLVQCIQDTLATPSLAQAQELKRLSQKDELDEDKMVDMLMDVKPNQKEKLSLKMEEINKYFPKSYTPMQKKDIIIKLLGDWAKRKDKSMER